MVARTVAAFTPVNTDCMRWTRIDCNVLQDCPNGESPPCCPNMVEDPLVLGYQQCAGAADSSGAMHAAAHFSGVQGMQLCITTDGEHVGHNSIFHGLGFKSNCGAPTYPGNHRGCWISTDSSAQLDHFWRADFARSNLTWTKFKRGDAVPSNAYQVNGRVLARSTGSVANIFGVKGSLVPGWITPSGGKLGPIEYEDHGPLTEDSFFLATCHPPTLLPYTCNAEHLCVTVPHGQNGSFPTQQKCAAACIAPPPPPPTPAKYACRNGGQCGATNATNGTVFPTAAACRAACKPPPGPPPPPPSYAKPFLRFAMVLPAAHKVDCTIVQGATTHTWSDYGFGQFSDWVEIFANGDAAITLQSGGVTVLRQPVTLTPGPLVVALRADNVPAGHVWPPTSTSIEAIAASYTPAPAGSSAVRLVNLSPDLQYAGLRRDGAPPPLATDIAYGDASAWAPVPAQQASFTVVNSLKNATVARATGTPPYSPSAATVYVFGLVADAGTFAPRALLLDDAPLAPMGTS